VTIGILHMTGMINMHNKSNREGLAFRGVRLWLDATSLTPLRQAPHYWHYVARQIAIVTNER
jgi:hypothetical protein